MQAKASVLVKAESGGPYTIEAQSHRGCAMTIRMWTAAVSIAPAGVFLAGRVIVLLLKMQQ